MSEPKRANVSMRLYGPNVTREGTVEAGQHLVNALDAVAEHMGLPTGLWRCKDAEIACDTEGCESRRPWDAEGHGWVRTAGGLDYCPNCIVTAPRT